MSVLDRVPIERISAEAREIRAGRRCGCALDWHCGEHWYRMVPAQRQHWRANERRRRVSLVAALRLLTGLAGGGEHRPGRPAQGVGGGVRTRPAGQATQPTNEPTRGNDHG